MARPRLVILGSGFAGYSLARNLQRDQFETTIVAPRNYFVFTPLLPSALVGTVEFRSILEPVRRRVRGARMVEAEATAVDVAARTVQCRAVVTGEELTLPFDLLVVAVGCAVADYGVAGVAEHALRRAANQQIVERAMPVGTHHDVIRLQPPGLRQNARHRMTGVVHREAV